MTDLLIIVSEKFKQQYCVLEEKNPVIGDDNYETKLDEMDVESIIPIQI